MNTKRKIIINLSILLISGIVFVVLIVDKSMEDMWKAKGEAAYDTRNEYYGLLVLATAQTKLVKAGFDIDGFLNSFLGFFSKKFYESAIEKIPEDDAERAIFYNMYKNPEIVGYNVYNNKEFLNKEILKIFDDLSTKKAASEWVSIIERPSIIEMASGRYYSSNKPEDKDFEVLDEKITSELTKLTKESLKAFPTNVFLKREIPDSQKIIPLLLARAAYIRTFHIITKDSKIDCTKKQIKDLLYLRLTLKMLLPIYKKEKLVNSSDVLEYIEKKLDDTREVTSDIFKNCNVRMEMNNDG